MNQSDGLKSGKGAQTPKSSSILSGIRPLRIMMIAPTPYFSDRGCHVRIFEEARALIARGHQVRIVTYHLGRDLEPVPVDRTCSMPWYAKREAGPSWHKLYLDLFLFIKAVVVARHYRPHVIHAHLHEGALIGWFVARLRKIPLLFDYQGSLSGESLSHGFYQNGSLLHRFFKVVEKKINGLADLIITSSTPGLRDLIRLWHQPKERVVAFPDGVDTTVFKRFSQREGRQKLGLDDQVPVVVYLGLLNRYQGVDLLLDAAKLLILQGRNFHLVVMGYPDAEYRKKAEELNIASFVTFTGQVAYADAPLLLTAGDLAVSPKISDTEANGKLLNYMACGLPVVAFDTPVNRELLGDGGIYAAYGDAEDLARCLALALADRNLLHQQGKQMRERAVELHGWENRVQLLESYYHRLLKVKK